MKRLNKHELSLINGGGPIIDIWNDCVELVTKRLPDFFRGIADGFKSA